MYLYTLVKYVAVVVGFLRVTEFSLEQEKEDQTELRILINMKFKIGSYAVI